MKLSALLLTALVYLLQGIIAAASLQWQMDMNRLVRLDYNQNGSNTSNINQSISRRNFRRNNAGRRLRPAPRQNLQSNELPIALNADNYPPNWNGGYYKYHQVGNALIPYPGATQNLGRTRGNARAHRAKIVTTILKPGEEWKYNQTQHIQHRPRNSNRRRRIDEFPSDEPITRDRKPCVVCPEERSLVANKKLDRVLFVEPTLKSCKGRILNKKYKFKSVFGVKPGDLLPHGTHALVGEILFKDKPIQTCHLRVNVITRQCGVIPTPENMSVTCDAGHLWGSKCTFVCKNQNDELKIERTNGIFCNDDLHWIGEVPKCVPRLDSCETPIDDLNLRYLCSTSADQLEDYSRLPQGTRCRIECSKGLRSFPKGASAVCSKGVWVGHTKVKCRRQRRNVKRRRHL